MAKRRTDRKKAPQATRKLTDFLVACAAEADPRERIRMAREAIQALPRESLEGHRAVRGLLAHALVDAGDLDGARKEWLKLATGKKGRARARIEAGLLAEAAGRFDLAESDYRAAVVAGEDLGQKGEAVAVLARF